LHPYHEAVYEHARALPYKLKAFRLAFAGLMGVVRSIGGPDEVGQRRAELQCVPYAFSDMGLKALQEGVEDREVGGVPHQNAGVARAAGAQRNPQTHDRIPVRSRNQRISWRGIAQLAAYGDVHPSQREGVSDVVVVVRSGDRTELALMDHASSAHV